MNVLILEDENKAARELSRIIRQIDSTIKVVAIIDSIEMCKQWFECNESPDLIFSDIQLADGLCFDLFNQFEIQSSVVFCTAFDEYLMAAFDTNAVSYLLKPITLEKVEKALFKFKNIKDVFQKQQSIGHLSNLLIGARNNYKSTLLVHRKEKIIPVAVNDIALIYLDGTLVSILTKTNQKYYISASLDELEKVINPLDCYRANRQFIVFRDAIETVEKFFARKLVVQIIVKIPETIIVSKAKSSDFLKWLEA